MMKTGSVEAGLELVGLFGAVAKGAMEDRAAAEVVAEAEGVAAKAAVVERLSPGVDPFAGHRAGCGCVHHR